MQLCSYPRNPPKINSVGMLIGHIHLLVVNHNSGLIKFGIYVWSVLNNDACI